MLFTTTLQQGNRELLKINRSEAHGREENVFLLPFHISVLRFRGSRFLVSIKKTEEAASPDIQDGRARYMIGRVL